MHKTELLSARQAAHRLGIRLPTLYAYVSRGLLRSVPGERKGRRLYFREDVDRLHARHRAHAGHGAVAAGALRWGEPVLDSALTEIGPGGPRYRGRDAVGFAESGVSFEAVAEWLWGAAGLEPAARWPPEAPGVDAARLARLLPKDARPLESLALALPALAAGDRSRHGSSREAQLERARRLVRGLAAALSLPASARRFPAAVRGASLAGSILSALERAPRRREEDAINQALILCADHELNPSTFAARVAASTGADLYACVGAALATLSGPLHGGVCDRVEMLVVEAAQPGRAAAMLDARLRRGDSVPGFGHPLYPHGDPRGRLLLQTAHRLKPRSQPLRTLLAIVDAMRERDREAPTVDAGLVALALALGLPPGTAVGLFAVGRAAGWIAHALEQQEAGFVLRPRARYVGPPADSEGAATAAPAEGDTFRTRGV